MADARKLATYEDLLALPEHLSGEIVDGELIVMPRPRPRHGNTQARVARHLGGPFEDADEPGGWWIVVEPLLELSRSRLVAPDLAGWRRERLPDLPEDPRIRVIPDWVCEVLSPGNVAHDRVTKANLYVEHGVRWMWPLDLDDRVVEAWQNHEAAWRRAGAWDATASAAHIPPFDAVPLDVAALFPPR